MQSVALLEIDTARVLLERLKRDGIFAELQSTSQEGEVEMGDILVEDDQYERACDVADLWQAELTEAGEKASGSRCPKCKSWHLETLLVEERGRIYRCRDCNCEFALT